MKNRAHAGHLFRRGRVEFRHATAGDRRFDWNGIEHPREVKVRGVHGCATHLQRTVDARLAFADYGSLCGFGHN
jgi:hypothetical protein